MTLSQKGRKAVDLREDLSQTTSAAASRKIAGRIPASSEPCAAFPADADLFKACKQESRPARIHAAGANPPHFLLLRGKAKKDIS